MHLKEEQEELAYYKATASAIGRYDEALFWVFLMLKMNYTVY